MQDHYSSVFPHSHLTDIFEKDFEYAESIGIPQREALLNLDKLEEFKLISTKLQSIIKKITEHLRILTSTGEDSNLDRLIIKVTNQLSLINACRKKHMHLDVIFEHEFQYTDAIVIPINEDIHQNPTKLANLLLVTENLKSITKRVTKYIQIQKLETQMTKLLSRKSDEDSFIKQIDVEDGDLKFRVTDLDNQVKLLTNETVHLRTTLKEKDLTMTKLVNELLVLNETLRKKSQTEKELLDEIAKLKRQTINNENKESK